MKFAIYRDLDGKIKKTHPLKDLPADEIATAVNKFNAEKSVLRAEAVDVEDDSLVVFLWHAFDEKVKSLHSEIREAEDAAADLSQRLYSLREAAGDTL